MLDWLRLIRASGLGTILSNLLAAAFVATYLGDSFDWKVIAALVVQGRGWSAAWIVAASALLYASGMLWNDLADLERDRVLHPQRPLPAGRIGVGSAWVVAAVTSVSAIIAGGLGGGVYGFHAAGLVLSLALLYNFATKHVPWLGSMTMAAVRMSHALFALLLLGPDRFTLAGLALLRPFGVAAAADAPAKAALYPLLLGTYILGVTLVSELESRRGRRWELAVGGTLIVVPMLAALTRLVTAPWLGAWQQTGSYVQIVGGIFLGLAIAALWSWRILVPLIAALRIGRRGLIGPVVGAALGGMILLDALLATSAHPLGGLLILPLYPLFIGVARAIRMD